MVDEDSGKYYDFDLSRLARECQRDQHALPHKAPEASHQPPILAPSSKTTYDNQSMQFLDFMPVVSNGKHIGKQLSNLVPSIKTTVYT